MAAVQKQPSFDKLIRFEVVFLLYEYNRWWNSGRRYFFSRAREPNFDLWTFVDVRLYSRLREPEEVSLRTSFKGFTSARACLPPELYQMDDKLDHISLTFTKNQIE
jgi:hypothetical protein